MSTKAISQHCNAGMDKEAIFVPLTGLIYSNRKFSANATTRDCFEMAVYAVREET